MLRTDTNTEREWRSCRRCPLSESRGYVVIRGRGSTDGNGNVDRDGLSVYNKGETVKKRVEGRLEEVESSYTKILFIGEAPGEAEDLRGIPFQGKAGKILNLCLSFCTVPFTFELTNIIACRPTRVNKYKRVVNRPPSHEEIKACLPRIESMVNETYFEGVVYLGKVAQVFKTTLPNLSLIHPAAILREEYKLVSIREFAYQLDRYVSNLSN